MTDKKFSVWNARSARSRRVVNDTLYYLNLLVDTAENRPFRVALSEHQLGKRSARKADVQLAQLLLRCKNGLDRRKTVQKESRVQGSGRRGAPSLRL